MIKEYKESDLQKIVDDFEELYSLIWRYKIKPDKRERFEFEYGLNGSWARLFNESKKYKGSLLLKSTEEVNTYTLIDTWTDIEAYKTFLKENDQEYNKLSVQFESLYEIEMKMK